MKMGKMGLETEKHKESQNHSNDNLRSIAEFERVGLGNFQN